MRALIYTLLIAALPMIVEAGHIERQLEGYWENHYTDSSIKIKAQSYGFKIKGIEGERGWTKFKKNKHGQFQDHCGNRLLIRHDRLIEIHYRALRRTIPYRKKGSNNNYSETYHNGVYQGGHGHNPYEYSNDGYYEQGSYYGSGYSRGADSQGTYRSTDRRYNRNKSTRRTTGRSSLR